MGDIFRMQQRLDEFRSALGHYGRELNRTAELDELLDLAERNAWPAERLGHYIAGRLPREAGAGLVILTLRSVARSPEPATPNEHQRAAIAGRRGTFRQPMPPCGECDGSPARWLDVTPDGHRGARQVVHCPRCWTAPPGYLAPAARGGHVSAY